MARHPKPPSPSPPPRPPPESDASFAFDPVEEWLVDFEQAMSGELEAKSLGPAEESVVPHAPEPPTTCDVSAGKVSDGSAAPESCEFGVEEQPVEEVGSLEQAGSFCGGEIDEEAEMVSGGVGELLAPDQLLASGVGGLAVKEDVSEGAVAMETAAAPAEVTNTAMSVEEGGGGSNAAQGSSEEESESDEGEKEESSEASSSGEEDESSEASSSSDEEDLGLKGRGGVGGAKGDNMAALLEEGELMVASDEEDEEPKGRNKFKHEAEVLPPVPKIEIQLEPHHQALPVGTISAVMGERVIVEGSVQHNPLNEGSILWITESRKPLGIVDELFGPVKNPYYLIRYNSEEEVPAGISVGTSVSFVAEFADHILNLKELYAKGYDESGDIDDQEDEPEFSDDEKEAEYKRSLRQAKRQTDRQNEPKKPSGDNKRSQARGGGFRKDMPPRNRDTPTPGHQSQPHFHRSDMAPAVAENIARSLGSQNVPVGAPTMMPPGPMNRAMPSPAHLANQMGGCFINPAQQFFPQQPNMAWPGGGLPPPLHPNMGMDGAALAANIMQNLLAGANQFQQQLQNQNFSGFPNQMQMPFPQFMPQPGMPANPMPFGGPPVNSPFGSAPQVPTGQGNFGQPPNPQGFANLAQPHGDGGDLPPAQFNSGQFDHGSSSFRGRRPHQRGGRHSSGRGGGRGGRNRR